MQQFMRSTKKRIVTDDGGKRSRNEIACMRVKDITPKLFKVKSSAGHFVSATKRQRLDTIVLE